MEVPLDSCPIVEIMRKDVFSNVRRPRWSICEINRSNMWSKMRHRHVTNRYLLHIVSNEAVVPQYLSQSAWNEGGHTLLLVIYCFNLGGRALFVASYIKSGRYVLHIASNEEVAFPCWSHIASTQGVLLISYVSYLAPNQGVVPHLVEQIVCSPKLGALNWTPVIIQLVPAVGVRPPNVLKCCFCERALRQICFAYLLKYACISCCMFNYIGFVFVRENTLFERVVGVPFLGPSWC
jgi:hypothetical protein